VTRHILAKVNDAAADPDAEKEKAKKKRRHIPLL
jgi:hypothetical protein